jgi:hypothetical protein
VRIRIPGRQMAPTNKLPRGGGDGWRSSDLWVGSACGVPHTVHIHARDPALDRLYILSDGMCRVDELSVHNHRNHITVSRARYNHVIKCKHKHKFKNQYIHMKIYAKSKK